MVAPLKAAQPFVIPKIDLTQVGKTSSPGIGGAGESPATSAFSEKLREVVESANEMPAQGEKVAADYASGKQNDLHGTMVSMAQADISLRMVANVRNRAIEAYREIMRMGG